jgi:hypothetical protein
MPNPLRLTPIVKSLLKREEAMMKHIARKEAFLRSREKIIKEIEEARTIWKHTLEQLPVQEFNSSTYKHINT